MPINKNEENQRLDNENEAEQSQSDGATHIDAAQPQGNDLPIEDVPEDAPENSVNGKFDQTQKQLAEQKAKVEDNFNRLVRLQADFDNYRKRVQKEKEEFFKYASVSLCEALLPVLDNFQLALAASEQDPAKVLEGVEMIYRQLQDVLQKEGLEPIEAVGREFDPSRHEAIMQENTDAHPDNTVIEELRRGYYLRDRLLRPAMVKVAKS